MKILVAIKHAADYPNKINPYDAVAVEEALRLRDAGAAREVVVVSIGANESQETLRSALAMGVDRAIFVHVEDRELQPLAVAKILRVLVNQELAHLLILGRQAVGGDYGHTGQMLAAMLDWPQATFVTKVGLGAEGHLEITRETDNGLQVLGLQLPAVITVELCLNEPRLITLPHIIKAQRKRLETILLEDLMLEVEPRLFIRKLTPATKCRVGIKVKDVAELLHKLRYEAKVL